MTSASSPDHSARLALLVKRFPRLSETFILNEYLELRRQALPVDLYAIMDPHEARSHPEALAVVPDVTYLQEGSLWASLPAAGRAARRHPVGTLRAAGWVVTRHSVAAVRNLVHALVLVEKMERRGPAHLHAHFLHSPSAIAFIAHKISGQPYSVTGHAKDIYTTLEENVVMRCRDAEFVTTCTSANRDHLLTVTRLDPSTIHLCRHGVDVSRFTDAERRPVPGRIVSVGRLVPKKGFELLIRACADLRRRGVAFDLHIVGGGELKESLHALAESEGIGEHVTLLGASSQEQVVKELAAAEVFALTPVILPDGDRDGIPNVILEAMAAGLPVVAAAVSGIPEVVTDGLDGRLVPEGDVEAVAAALAELLSDGTQRDRLGAAGRRRVEGECGWENAIVPLASLFRSVLAMPDNRAAGPVEAEVA